MNFHFLWHDIQHGLFHFDKGILYTTKQLFTNPGKTIREFIHGKRVKHFKPVSYVVILATVYGLLYNYLHIDPGVMLSDEKGKKAFEMVNHWIANHYAISTLIMLPIYSFATYLVFKKQGYNFVEHFVINSFLAGQRLVMHLAILPFWYLNNGSLAIKFITTSIDFLFFIWGFSSFFSAAGKFKPIFKSVLAYLLFFIFLIVASSVVGIIIALVQKGLLKR